MSAESIDPAWPVVAPPVWDAIPPELAQRQQWLLWKYEAKPGQAKPAKMPYYCQGGKRTGGQGDDRDRMRLATLEVVRRVFDKGGWTGVGFGFLPGDGLIGIDIDGAIDAETGEVQERCQKIIDACASFTEYSPSGKGVHIYVLGHTATAKSNDIGLEMFCERQFFTVTGRAWAGSPATVQAIDEGVLKRLHATIQDAKDKRKGGAADRPATPPNAAQPSGGAGGESAAALRARVEGALQAISPDVGYNDWISIGWALREAFGDFGFGLWDAWSSRSAKYKDSADLQSHWKSFAPGKSPDQAVGVIFARAKEHGYVPPRRASLASVGGVKKKSNKAATAPDGSDLPAAGGPPGEGDGGGDGGSGDDGEGEGPGPYLVRNRNKPVDCRENVLYCLRHDPVLHGLVQHNEFTELHERSRSTPWGRPPGEWDEEDDLMLGEYLVRNHHVMSKATGTLRAGVMMAARVHKFNPVMDLIRAEAWDGTVRLPHWITDCLGVEYSDYVALVGECFVKGMVARALRPGCKFDYMLILKGPQGARKSTVFRTLAEPFFTDNAIRMGDKDSLMALQSIWIAESSELESMSKSETNAVKQFLSASEDLYRPPYGARMVKRPRHAVMGGTTNADVFLKDVTGDRRFWPVEVGDVDIDRLKAMRAQLFAEALVMLQSDDPEQRRTYPTPEQERELVIPAQERFKMTDVWEDILADYVNCAGNDKWDSPMDPVRAEREFFSTRELFDNALQIKADRIDGNRMMETRIGNCMKALGFDKFRESKGERKRGYVRQAAQQAQQGPKTGRGKDDDDLPI